MSVEVAKAKHTAGPWRVAVGESNCGGVNGSAAAIVAPMPDAYYIADVWDDFEAEDESDERAGLAARGTGAANARLIAVAPEEHDALTKLTNEVDGLCAFEIEIREAIGNTNWAVLRQRVEEARAVLAKAEGRQS